MQLAHERHRSAIWAQLRAVELGEQPVVETGRGDRVAHRGGDLADRLRGAEHLARVGAAEREPGHEVRPLGGPGPDHEPLVELGEHEVVAAARPRARCPSRCRSRCEAAVVQLTAIDERVPAPGAVVLVGVRAAEEDAVLDAQRGQLAGADAQEREPGRVDRGRLEADGPAVAPPDVERHDRAGTSSAWG